MIFVIGGAILICIIYGIYKIRKQQLNGRQQGLNNYDTQIKILQSQIKDYEKTIQNYDSQIEKIKEQADFALNNLGELNQKIVEKQNEIKDQDNNLWQLKSNKDKLELEYEQKFSFLQSEYQLSEQEYDRRINDLQSEVDKLSNTLAAAAEANLREQEKKNNLSFYRINLSDTDLEDIEQLNLLKKNFHHPEVISKLIWTQYIQKRVGQMCARVFNVASVCGVYKITNINTQQYYIGQSVNVVERMKEHVKHGLGIDYNGNNKLYCAMQEQGVWNFTFELMEKCQRAQLDEVEAKWIELYQADTLGYNSTQGNNKGK